MQYCILALSRNFQNWTRLILLVCDEKPRFLLGGGGRGQEGVVANGMVALILFGA